MNPIKRFLARQFYWPVMELLYEEQQSIGKVYCGFFRGMATAGFCPLDTAFGPGQRVTFDFYSFKPCDIEDIKRDQIKLWGYWFPLDDVILPGEDKKKEEIIARHKSTDETRRENAQWCAKTELEIERDHPIRGIFG